MNVRLEYLQNKSFFILLVKPHGHLCSSHHEINICTETPFEGHYLKDDQKWHTLDPDTFHLGSFYLSILISDLYCTPESPKPSLILWQIKCMSSDFFAMTCQTIVMFPCSNFLQEVKGKLCILLVLYGGFLHIYWFMLALQFLFAGGRWIHKCMVIMLVFPDF